MWVKLVLLAGAGGLGAVSRYGLSLAIHRWVPGDGPASSMWATLGVNLLGCLLFGLVWSFTESRMAVPSHTRLVVLVGFLGSFTTFSTFAFETGSLIRASQWWSVAVNLAAHNLLGIAASMIGIALGKAVA